MPAIIANVVPFLFYWVFMFAICYIAVEYGQSYLYDEATPSAALKVALGSFLLALILTYFKPFYQEMIGDKILGTVILGLASFVIFTFIYRFHPWHGAAVGIGSVLLFAGLATMALDSFSNRNRPESDKVKYPSKPLRRASGVPAAAIPATPEAKK